MSAERWLPVPGFEGRYDVSDRGRVRSWSSRRRQVPFVMRQHTAWGGYPQVSLERPGFKRSMRVYRLVALTFLGPRPDGMCVRHLDGDATNTLLTNLAYGTYSENEQDTMRHGRHHQLLKTHCPREHPYDEVNTYVNPTTGARVCRTCLAARDRARRAVA